MPMNRPCSTTPAMRSRSARQGFGRFNGTEGAVQNVVAVVGDEVATLGFRAKVLDAPSGRLPAKLGHFDRNGCCAQHADHLGLVDDHQESGAGLGHDLFPQECTAAALDEIQCVSVDFIGPVDGDVESARVNSVRGIAELAGARGAYVPRSGRR